MAKGGAREGAGRPKGAFSVPKKSIIEMAQEQAPAALQTLFNCLNAEDSTWKDKSAAAIYIINRAIGTPLQSVQQTTEAKVSFVAAMPDVQKTAEAWATANGGSIIVEDDDDKD
jgi:hypothetical protein